MIPMLAPAEARGKFTLDVHGNLLNSASRTQARRRWIFRTSLLLALSAALLCSIVFVRRDRMTVNDNMRAMDAVVLELQSRVDVLGQLPLSLPVTAGSAKLVYAPGIVREYAREAPEAVIVASTPRIPLVLSSDGSPVVLYERGKVRREWWTRPQFVAAWQEQETRVKRWEQKRRATLPVLP